MPSIKLNEGDFLVHTKTGTMYEIFRRKQGEPILCIYSAGDPADPNNSNYIPIAELDLTAYDVLFAYGPILTEDHNEITLYLDRRTLTDEEAEKLVNGSDDFLLANGGGAQARYVPEEYIAYIALKSFEDGVTSNISYEEYIARINTGNFKNVDFFVSRPFLPEKIKQLFDDIFEGRSYDGLIYRGEEYDYAVAIVDDKFYASYFISLKATLM